MSSSSSSGSTDSSTRRPEFSVIIPVHGDRRELPNAVSSVLTQTTTDLEVVVVDDRSLVDPRDLLADMPDSRIRFVKADGTGPSAARNAGISSARGQMITFLDSDDLADSNWLETMRAALTPEVGVVCCAAIFRNRVTGETKVRRPAQAGPAYRSQRSLFLAGTFAYRAELGNDDLLYDAMLRYSENSEFGIRLVARCLDRRLRVVALDEPLVQISKDEQPRHSLDRIDAVERILKVHDSLMRLDSAMGGDYAAVAAVECSRTRRWPEARGWFRKALTFKPRSWSLRLRLFIAGIPLVRDLVWPSHKA